jgi:hypothetical protein
MPVDPNAVRDGDTLTYTGLHGPDVTGRVIYAVQDGVLVETPGGQYKIAWHRVTGHQPQEGRTP